MLSLPFDYCRQATLETAERGADSVVRRRLLTKALQQQERRRQLDAVAARLWAPCFVPGLPHGYAKQKRC